MKGTSLLIVGGQCVGYAEVELDQATTTPPETFTALPGVYEATMQCSADPEGVRELFEALRPKSVDLHSMALFDVTTGYLLDPRGWMPVFDMDGNKVVRVTRHGVEVVRHGCRIELELPKEGVQDGQG